LSAPNRSIAPSTTRRCKPLPKRAPTRESEGPRSRRGLGPSGADVALREAEQSALEALALEEFLKKEAAKEAPEPLALPNYLDASEGSLAFTSASDRPVIDEPSNH